MSTVKQAYVSNNIDHSKAFMMGVNILDKWQCTSAQKQAILSIPKSTYHRYLKEPNSVLLNPDQLERLSYIANIHQALRIVFSNPDNVYGFMKMKIHTLMGVLRFRLSSPAILVLYMKSSSTLTACVVGNGDSSRLYFTEATEGISSC